MISSYDDEAGVAPPYLKNKKRVSFRTKSVFFVGGGFGDFAPEYSINPPVTLPWIEKASFRFHLPLGFNTWNGEIA